MVDSTFHLMLYDVPCVAAWKTNKLYQGLVRTCSGQKSYHVQLETKIKCLDYLERAIERRIMASLGSVGDNSLSTGNTNVAGNYSH